MRSLLPTPNTTLRFDYTKQYGSYASFGVGLAYAQIENDVCYRLSPPTGCKDYLTDALAWNDEDYPASKIDEGNYKFFADYDKENTTMWIGADLTDRIKILNEYEENIGVEKTQCFPIAEGRGTAVCGDKWWMTTTIHFSMFMSLLRYIQPGGTANLSLMGTEVDGGRDAYVEHVWDRLRVLPQALKKLQNITIKRNAPKIEGQHALNGHYCLLTNTPIRKMLTYGPQLMAIAPELFVTKKEVF